MKISTLFFRGIIIALLVIGQPALLAQSELEQNRLGAINQNGEQINFLKNLLGKETIVDYTFAKISLSDYLNIFSSEYGINIINDASSVSKRLSFSLKSMHPLDIFDQVIRSWGCVWSYADNVIRVVNQEPVRVFKLSYANAQEVLNSASAVVNLSGMSISIESNAIVARGSEDKLEQLGQIVSNLDVLPRQVLIQVKIIETSDDNENSLGLDFQSLNVNPLSHLNLEPKGFSEKAEASTEGLFFSVVNQDISAKIEALEKKADSKVLAHPKLLVTNHKTATIVTGQRLGYSTSTQTATSVIQNIKFLETGIKLNFTPHISKFDDILMDISPEVSEGQIVNELPRESTTKTETQVVVLNGSTIIIGGLIQQKETQSNNGVPFLSDIPFVNLLFSKTSTKLENREIVILITPHIVDLYNNQDQIYYKEKAKAVKSTTSQEEKG